MSSRLALALASLRTFIAGHGPVAVAAVGVAAVVAVAGVVIVSHRAPGPQSASTSPSPEAAGHGGGRQRTIASQLIRLTARDTGQTVSAVKQQLGGGKTLAAVAGSQDSAIQSQELAALKQKLDQQVAAGKLTAGQEARRLQKDTSTIQELMSEPGPQLLQLLGSGRGSAGGQGQTQTQTASS